MQRIVGVRHGNSKVTEVRTPKPLSRQEQKRLTAGNRTRNG